MVDSNTSPISRMSKDDTGIVHEAQLRTVIERLVELDKSVVATLGG